MKSQNVVAHFQICSIEGMSIPITKFVGVSECFWKCQSWALQFGKPTDGGGRLNFLSRDEHQSLGGAVHISNTGFPHVVEASEYFETESYKSLAT